MSGRRFGQVPFFTPAPRLEAILNDLACIKSRQRDGRLIPGQAVPAAAWNSLPFPRSAGIGPLTR
jgi:hypothetical protein